MKFLRFTFLLTGLCLMTCFTSLKAQSFINTFYGHEAGKVNTGSWNSFYGAYSGTNNTSGSLNAFFGASSGKENTTGSENAFFGDASGFFNTEGKYNSYFGRSAGKNNKTGSRNSYFGQVAGAANTGDGNSFFGAQAGRDNITGSMNAFFGADAGVRNSGSRNTFVGTYAGQISQQGAVNVYLGYAAGIVNTGSGNVYLGNDAGKKMTAENNALRIANNGDKTLITGDFANNRVGIGVHDLAKLDPSATLTVAGKIHSQEIEVSRNAGADFVFENNYDLKKLEEVEKFVKEKKHLPEIPSEAAMIKNGLNVGDFQIKLLQKVEELTLYLIEQNKKMTAQHKTIESLTKKYEQVTQELNKLKADK